MSDNKQQEPIMIDAETMTEDEYVSAMAKLGEDEVEARFMWGIANGTIEGDDLD